MMPHMENGERREEPQLLPVLLLLLPPLLLLLLLRLNWKTLFAKEPAGW